MNTARLNNLLSIIFFLLVLLCSLSCGKGDVGSDGDDSSEKYLTCKLNGKKHNFNYSVNANDKPAEEIIHFVVIGGWEQKETSKSPGFGISILVPAGAKEATYSVAGGSIPELDGGLLYTKF